MPNFFYRGFYAEVSRNDSADTTWFCEVYLEGGATILFYDAGFKSPEDGGESAMQWIDKNKHRISEFAEED
ncbi:MAG: hypothetical protein RMY34_01300 [Aulosira sp. DedQUE10]|nr:hypothetical protein [Aulosira sp. DedQUE10]